MDDGHKLVISVSEVLSGWSFISLVGPWQFCVCVSIVPVLLQLLACVCRGHTKVTHRTSFLFLRHVGWAVGAELNMPYLACGCLRSHPYIFIELLKLFLYIMCPFLILPYVAFFLFFVLQLVCVPPQKLCCRVWGRSGECNGAEIHSSCLRLQGCDQKRDVSQQIFCRVLQLLIGPVTMCGAKCEALLGILK